jgi:hypothetical protein
MTIAAKLAANTGPKLLMAAAAHLGLVAKKETFTRDEILEQMKSATGYYKSTYVGNLTKSVGTAIKDGNLSEHSKNVYALTPSTQQHPLHHLRSKDFRNKCFCQMSSQ